MLLYVAGPYRAKNGRTIEEHIAVAREAAVKLWEAGHYVLCPHLNTAGFERDCCASDDAYLRGGLEMLSRCDGVVLLPCWGESEGARAELAHALDRHMPVWEWPHDLPD